MLGLSLARDVWTCVEERTPDVDMWVRKIMRLGTSDVVTLPAPALDALGWSKGDMLLVRLHDEHELRITKFNPATAPDRVLRELEPLPEIKYV